MMLAPSNKLEATRWEALGTSATLLVTERCALREARTIVERELALIDHACSRFRPDSELQRVNAGAGRFVRVSSLLIEAVEVALRAAELTDGDVDPTLGNALELAGYDRDWQLLPKPPAGSADSGLSAGSTSPGCAGPFTDGRSIRTRRPAIRVRSIPGWQTIDVDHDASTIRLASGVSLDLGATAKAWAADRAAQAVHRATGVSILVSLGGDIATCGTAPDGGWRIHVADDHRSSPTAPGQTISIASGGLATSSTAVRRWSHRGRTMHHIIDPDTGQPVLGTWRTVSVAAATCLDANVASTAAVVRAGGAPAWLGQLGLPARLVSARGAVRLVSGWPSQADTDRALERSR